jgi:tryptophanyl-tRNA synthetase
VDNHAVDSTSTSSIVTPWNVSGVVDYEKLIEQFGSQKIDQALLNKMERLTGRPLHPFLRRGIFFSHRDLHEILALYESGTKFYLYTGRGPSSDALHLGHMIPFLFTQYLQEAFQVPCVIQLTDDEKFLFSKDNNKKLEDYQRLGWENAKDILAVGFDVERTFIFRNTDYIHSMYPNILKIQKAVTYNQAKAIFGFDDSDNIVSHLLVGWLYVFFSHTLSLSFVMIFGGIGKTWLSSSTSRAILFIVFSSTFWFSKQSPLSHSMCYRSRSLLSDDERCGS